MFVVMHCHKRESVMFWNQLRKYIFSIGRTNTFCLVLSFVLFYFVFAIESTNTLRDDDNAAPRSWTFSQVGRRYTALSCLHYKQIYLRRTDAVKGLSMVNFWYKISSIYISIGQHNWQLQKLKTLKCFLFHWNWTYRLWPGKVKVMVQTLKKKIVFPILLHFFFKLLSLIKFINI